MKILEIENVSKKIKKRTIIDHISFSIDENEIVGLVGPNGAGKSTLMKCITGLYHMSSGTVKICEYDLNENPASALKNVGMSIEYPSLYPELSGHEHFKLIANWKKLDKNRIKEMEVFSGLKNDLNREVKNYSMGMKQRIVLALAMMSNPKLLIIDEPTNGLDPQAIFDLRNQLLNIKNEGTSILLSSHQLNELDKLADRVVFIKKGLKIKEENMKDIKKNHFVYELETSNNILTSNLLNDVIFDKTKIRWTCKNKEEFSKGIEELVHNDILVYSISEVHQDLESYYKELYKG